MPYGVGYGDWYGVEKSPEEVAANVKYKPAAVRLPLEGDLPAEFRTPLPKQPRRGQSEEAKARCRWMLGLDAGQPLGAAAWTTSAPDDGTLSMLRAVAAALRTIGFEDVEVTYDGGGDEGFAEFAGAHHAGQLVDAKAVAAKLSGDPSALDVGALPNWIRQSLGDVSRPMSETLANLQLEFAIEIAAALFGASWGTGEYAVAGRFRVSLTTGAVTDLELERPPDFHDKLNWLWDEEE